VTTAKALPVTVPEVMPPALRAFGDDEGDFDRYVNMGKIQALSGMTAAAMLEVGRRLIWHKANLTHGEFMKDLASLPVGYRQAARMMNAARKLTGPNMTAPSLLRLGVAKVYELTNELDEDELDALVAGDAIDAVGSLDDIECMGVRQLRDVVRKGRKPKKRLSEAEEQVKELRKENEALRGRKLAPSVEAAKQQCRMFMDRMDEACRELNRVSLPEDEDCEEYHQIMAVVSGNLSQAETRLQGLQARLVAPYLER